MITRRDLIVAAVAAGTTMVVVALADTPATPVMRSSVFDWESAKVEPTKSGAQRAFFQARTATLDQLECHVTTLNPGEVPHLPHQHPDEELIILKEGALEVQQNGETKHAGTGSIIFQASNELHGLRNTGQTPAVYYVIRWSTPGALQNKTK